jgi:hypothetical protein
MACPSGTGRCSHHDFLETPLGTTPGADKNEMYDPEKMSPEALGYPGGIPQFEAEKKEKERAIGKKKQEAYYAEGQLWKEHPLAYNLFKADGRGEVSRFLRRSRRPA